jgi:hypothetical protein
MSVRRNVNSGGGVRPRPQPMNRSSSYQRVRPALRPSRSTRKDPSSAPAQTAASTPDIGWYVQMWSRYMCLCGSSRDGLVTDPVATTAELQVMAVVQPPNHPPPVKQSQSQLQSIPVSASGPPAPAPAPSPDCRVVHLSDIAEASPMLEQRRNKKETSSRDAKVSAMLMRTGSLPASVAPAAEVAAVATTTSPVAEAAAKDTDTRPAIAVAVSHSESNAQLVALTPIGTVSAWGTGVVYVAETVDEESPRNSLSTAPPTPLPLPLLQASYDLAHRSLPTTTATNTTTTAATTAAGPLRPSLPLMRDPSSRRVEYPPSLVPQALNASLSLSFDEFGVAPPRTERFLEVPSLPQAALPLQQQQYALNTNRHMINQQQQQHLQQQQLQQLLQIKSMMGYGDNAANTLHSLSAELVSSTTTSASIPFSNHNSHATASAVTVDARRFTGSGGGSSSTAMRRTPATTAGAPPSNLAANSSAVMRSPGSPMFSGSHQQSHSRTHSHTHSHSQSSKGASPFPLVSTAVLFCCVQSLMN